MLHRNGMDSARRRDIGSVAELALKHAQAWGKLTISPQTGRKAWLHLVRGEVDLGDVILTTGDGAGFTAERAVSLTAREETEILLLDLGVEVPGSSEN